MDVGSSLQAVGIVSMFLPPQCAWVPVLAPVPDSSFLRMQTWESADGTEHSQVPVARVEDQD